MADGNGSEGGEASPLWYALGALILVVLMMGTIVILKPLEFKPVPAAACEGEACAHEGAAPAGEPQSTSHAAPPAEHAPEGTSHQAPPHSE